MTVLSFVLLKSTPGGPLSIYQERADVSRADVARLRQQLGLDDPLPVQYAKWVGNLARRGLLPRTRPIVPGELAVSD